MRLAYDTLGLAFLKSVPYDSGSGWINMLASKGGALQSGIDLPSAANGFNLTLSGALARSDSLKCPGGSGALGWVRFRYGYPDVTGRALSGPNFSDRERNGNLLDADRLSGDT